MPMSARETAEFLLQVGRLMQAVGYSGGLSPAQWMALRYFSRANSFSRTPSAFAEFQATTRGTASIVIKELKAGGYLTQERSKADGRSIRLQLTAKGNKALARDPFEVLVRAMEALDRETKLTIHDGLEQVLSFIAAGGAHQRFGVCQNCTYLREENSSNPANTCALVQLCRRHKAPIPPDELNMLCAYFQPIKPGRAARSPRRREKQSARF
jgi:DNA-binding MarR family transcriptional regulator